MFDDPHHFDGVAGAHIVMVGVGNVGAGDIVAARAGAEVAFQRLQAAIGQRGTPETAGGVQQVKVGGGKGVGDAAGGGAGADEGNVEALPVERDEELLRLYAIEEGGGEAGSSA